MLALIFYSVEGAKKYRNLFLDSKCAKMTFIGENYENKIWLRHCLNGLRFEGTFSGKFFVEGAFLRCRGRKIFYQNEGTYENINVDRKRVSLSTLVIFNLIFVFLLCCFNEYQANWPPRSQNVWPMRLVLYRKNLIDPPTW